MLAEAHLVLGGVHIHIHLARGELDKERQDRIAPPVDDAPIGLHDGVLHDLVADKAPVDVGEHGLHAGAHQGRPGDEAMDGNVRSAVLHGIELCGAVFADHLGQSPLQVAALDPEEFPSIAGQGEGHLRAGDRHAAEHVPHMAGLGLGTLHELEPGRGVEEDLFDGDNRAGRHAAGLHIADLAPLDDHLAPLQAFGLSRSQTQTGDRGDRGERLTPETEGQDALQVAVGLDLAGGMALQGEQRVVAGHAVAVVADADQAFAPCGDLHGDCRRSGVEGVFDQLLDD